MHFIINLIRATIVCRKAFAKFILSYNFFLQICTLLPFIKLALMISGDIERNPGPENVHNQNLSLCHWNLNGIIIIPQTNTVFFGIYSIKFQCIDAWNYFSNIFAPRNLQLLSASSVKLLITNHLLNSYS